MSFLNSQTVLEANSIFLNLKLNGFYGGSIQRLHYKYRQNLKEIKRLQSISRNEEEDCIFNETMIDCIDMRGFLSDYLKLHTNLVDPEISPAEYYQCVEEDRQEAYEVARERGDYDI